MKNAQACRLGKGLGVNGILNAGLVWNQDTQARQQSKPYLVLIPSYLPSYGIFYCDANDDET
jgi:hypothetical protein